MPPEQSHRLVAPLQCYFALKIPCGVSQLYQEVCLDAITPLAWNVSHLSDLPAAFQSVQQA